MVAERLQTRYLRGFAKREWHLERGKRNEALDCRVMADAAAEYCGVRRAPWDRLEDAVRVQNADLFARETEHGTGDAPVADAAQAGAPAEADAAPESHAPGPTARPVRRRPGGFVNGWRK
jgi:phage terminase large subunit GpA-like protein